MKTLIATLTLAASGCTLGLEQDFELDAGPPVTDTAMDMLFTLTNAGGNAPEALELYRIEIDDQPIDASVYARSDFGDGKLILEQDGATPGVVDPGDSLRVFEYGDGTNLVAADNGQSVWINVMVLAPSQRSSDALTRTWQTVWSTEWRVGEAL